MNPPLTTRATVQGRLMQLYSVGWLAHFMGRSVFRVRHWERIGVLPRPLVSLPPETNTFQKVWPMRWYLAAEVIGYSQIFKTIRILPGVGIERTDFKRRVFEFRTALKKMLAKEIQRVPSELQNEKEVERRIKAARFKVPKELELLLKTTQRKNHETETEAQAAGRGTPEKGAIGGFRPFRQRNQGRSVRQG
jgi:hypothetical protein